MPEASREHVMSSKKYCIGIDLGGTFIKVGLLDANRRLVGTLQLPTPSAGGGRAVVDQIVTGARQIMDSENISPDSVSGVGIGAPGPLDHTGGIVIAMPNVPGMDGLRLRDLVSQGLSLPAVLENDANAAAFGEYICGAGSGAGDMVLLTLGTGVGSGIILDGKVLHGSHGIGGEIGHMIIEPGGEQCGCGQHGCLERYCSATYIARLARRLIEQEGRESSLRPLLERKGVIDAKDIQEACKSGDELAEYVWDNCAYYLSLGCVNICRVLDPDEIVLGGGMAKAGEDLMKPLMKHFRRLHWSLTEPKTKIVFATLGNDAGVIGAAGVAWQAFGAK